MSGSELAPFLAAANLRDKVVMEMQEEIAALTKELRKGRRAMRRVAVRGHDGKVYFENTVGYIDDPHDRTMAVFHLKEKHPLRLTDFSSSLFEVCGLCGIRNEMYTQWNKWNLRFGLGYMEYPEMHIKLFFELEGLSPAMTQALQNWFTDDDDDDVHPYYFLRHIVLACADPNNNQQVNDIRLVFTGLQISHEEGMGVMMGNLQFHEEEEEEEEEEVEEEQEEEDVENEVVDWKEELPTVRRVTVTGPGGSPVYFENNDGPETRAWFLRGTFQLEEKLCFPVTSFGNFELYLGNKIVTPAVSWDVGDDYMSLPLLEEYNLTIKCTIEFGLEGLSPNMIQAYQNSRGAEIVSPLEFQALLEALCEDPNNNQSFDDIKVVFKCVVVTEMTSMF